MLHLLIIKGRLPIYEFNGGLVDRGGEKGGKGRKQKRRGREK